MNPSAIQNNARDQMIEYRKDGDTGTKGLGIFGTMNEEDSAV